MSDLAKFYSDPPGEEMQADDVIYRLVWDDVLSQAEQYAIDSDRDPLPTDLTSEEMHVFRKCLENGLSCWAEVVELALMAATSERSER